jgi:hypothetical protein
LCFTESDPSTVKEVDFLLDMDDLNCWRDDLHFIDPLGDCSQRVVIREIINKRQHISTKESIGGERMKVFTTRSVPNLEIERLGRDGFSVDPS